jgi:uncharacterized protein YdeI (YjbR/CyaY-like superfamily)
MEGKNLKVDPFFINARQWHDEYKKLREIILDCGLKEELKWRHPCYSMDGKNIVLIHGFKDYCALLFMKGVLMKDPNRILIQQTENVQSARQIRFTNLQEINELESVLNAYINEAIIVEKEGLTVELKTVAEYSMPDEFQIRLEENPELENAFYALTPGRQRAYLLYFSSPKQSKTRTARVEKYTAHILDGKGLNDL